MAEKKIVETETVILEVGISEYDRIQRRIQCATTMLAALIDPRQSHSFPEIPGGVGVVNTSDRLINAAVFLADKLLDTLEKTEGV